MQDKRVKRSIIEFKRWAMRTTMEGLPNIVESTTLAGRIFWGIVVVAFFGILLLHLIMLINGYLTSKVSSDMKINSTSAVFPDVTICAMRPASESLVHYYSSAINLHLKRKWNFFDNWFVEERYRRANESAFEFITRVQRIYKKMLMILWSSDDISDIVFSSRVSILDCKFNGVKCDHRNFSLIQHANYWNCYVFKPQSSQALSSFLGDAEAGLSVNIFTDDNYFESNYQERSEFDASPYDEYYTKAMSMNDFLNNNPKEYPINILMAWVYDSDGVKVTLHLSRSNPLYDVGQLYRTFVVQNGMSATFRVETVVRNRWNTTSFTCVGDLGNISYVVSSDSRDQFERTSFDLYAERAQSEVKRLCGCYSHRFPLQTRKEDLCYYVPTINRIHPSKDKLDLIECHEKWYKVAGGEMNSGARYSRESDTNCKNMYREVQLDTTEWPNEEDVVSVVSHYFTQWLRDSPSIDRPAIVLNFTDPEVIKHVNASGKKILSNTQVAVLSFLKKNCSSNMSLATDFSPKYVRDAVTRCLNHDRVFKSLLRINVRLASLDAIIYEDQETYGLWEILSEVGGVIGLWFGISVMTLFEMGELMLIIALSRQPDPLDKMVSKQQGTVDRRSEVDALDELVGQRSHNDAGYTVGHPLSELNVELTYSTPDHREKLKIPVVVTNGFSVNTGASTIESDASDDYLEPTTIA